MPKWDERNILKLLIGIIKHQNVSNLPWEELSTTVMNSEFTAEAIRVKYNALKRNAGKSTTDGTPTTTRKVTKPVKATSASANGTATKRGRKRKATEAILESDEEYAAPRKSEKIKTEKEEAAMNGDLFGAELFKAEEDLFPEEGIDLEHDNLYDYDNAAA